MRHLMTIKYDGTNYHGWQVQKNAVTVQQTVQDALQSVFGTRPDVTGCSRTDSGVHANKYCFHFDYDGGISEKSLICALNAYLPSDIAALDCRVVSSDFHARYSVKSKEYIYKFYNGRIRDPFLNGYAYHINYPLDEKFMDKAAKEFIGEHDFSAFCAAGSSVTDNVRFVYGAEVRRQGDIVTFSVSANGFLYNMVRIMAGTLLGASTGKIPYYEIESIIKSKNRENSGATAPAHGLYLDDVIYDFEDLI